MDYICKWCGKEFTLSNNQKSVLRKNPNKPIFCSRQCSGQFYAKKSHEGKTEEQKQIRRDKIRNTLKQKELELTEEQKQIRKDAITNYWKGISPEQRSIILKQHVSKSKQTKKEKYGSETFNNETKRKQTNLNKYGITNTLNLEASREKQKQVMNEKYGVDNFFSNQGAFKGVMNERYGVDYAMQNKELMNKVFTTKYINWGNPNYNNQKKFEQTMLSKHGVTRPFHLKRYVEKSKQTKYKRYGDANYNNRMKANKTIYEKYGKNYYKHLLLNNVGNKISKLNIKFQNFLNGGEFEFPIGNNSYDIKYNDYLIEINPSFTHNSCETKLFERWGSLEKNYHYNKSKLAEENGYHCIHVWDWDDWDKIKYMVQNKEVLYARNLNCQYVPEQECDKFLNDYHIQNTCRGQEIRVGLYTHSGVLVQIMTFGKPRYNKNYEWELLRLCSHKDYRIIGGASKLFKHFITSYNPKSVISYCDYSKFNGGVYKELGFQLIRNAIPSKHWSKGEQHITDNLLRQRGFDQLFNTNYGKGTCNEELMLQSGWLPIYDCGNMTYLWEKD